MEVIVFFGASKYGELILNKFLEEDRIAGKEVFFCDNSSQKCGQNFHGYRVLSPEELLGFENPVIVIASQYSAQIAFQLFQMGIKEYHVAVALEEGGRLQLERFNCSGIQNTDIISNKICLIADNFSGSNTRALYKMIPEQYRGKLIIKLLDIKNKQEDFYYDLFTARVVISNQGTVSAREGQILIELWHGFPLKCMGYMVDSYDKINRFTSEMWNSNHLVASYSALYTALMSACFGVSGKSFKTTGMPRNDFLFKTDRTNNLSKILKNEKEYVKTVLYAPTFRKIETQYEEAIERNLSNVFGFEDFKEDKFCQFIERYNIRFILKFHPVEEKQLLEQIHRINNDNVFVLNDELLKDHKIDFYELLNECDLMITDYSSLYFDFLLLDRPIIFTPVDLEQYRRTRGLLLEPYGFWAPGVQAVNQNDLEQALWENLFGKDRYQEERSVVRKIVHHHEDERSSERLWGEIVRFIPSL